MSYRSRARIAGSNHRLTRQHDLPSSRPTEPFWQHYGTPFLVCFSGLGEVAGITIRDVPIDRYRQIA